MRRRAVIHAPHFASDQKKCVYNDANAASSFIHVGRRPLTLPFMKVVSSAQRDIVSLRMSHCRAEHAAGEARYHLAVLHYRECLESAEQREDLRATQFFAARLAECYAAMGLPEKADHFRAMAGADDTPLLG